MSPDDALLLADDIGRHWGLTPDGVTRWAEWLRTITDADRAADAIDHLKRRTTTPPTLRQLTELVTPQPERPDTGPELDRDAHKAAIAQLRAGFKFLSK